MIPGKLTAFLVLCTICAALVNAHTFGPETYAAFFFFTIAASITAAFIQVKLFRQKNKLSLSFPLPVILFVAICLYAFTYGLLTDTTGIAHYYMGIAGLLFVSLFSPGNTTTDSKDKKNRTVADNRFKFLHTGILVVSLAECIIVLFQFAKAQTDPDSTIYVSGSWVNPNVTATFLAASIHSIYASGILTRRRAAGILILFIQLLSILILKCRTAYIVTLIMLFPLIQPYLKKWVSSFGFKTRVIIPVIITALSILVLVTLLSIKKDSTSGRVQVWENSMSLIAESPVTGHGFGLFEKSYNEHVAHAGLPSNGYIKMAYNDFIELSVEGGLIAAFLWLAFIFSYFLYSRKNNYSLFPLIALVAIQLSNFVFQAVPVFALLIVYLALPTPYSALSTESSMIKKSRGLLSSKVKPISISMAIIAFALLVHQVRFANAFYKTDKIEKQYTPTLSIPEYKKLEPALEGHAYLHEKLGDSYMKTKKIHKALNEFTTALGTMYTPELLVKSGFCYQLQNKYDSSLYYYRLAHNIEPFKFATQHLILRLYEQKKDTGNIIKTATTIVNMPVKVENPRAYQLKTYAQNTINKILQQ